MRVEAAILISQCFADVSTIIRDCRQELVDMFVYDGDDNTQAAKDHDIHSLMCSLHLYSQFSSLYKKMYDNAKKDLDGQCAAAGLSPTVANGEDRVVAKNNVFVFSKKRNAATQPTSTTDLIIELTKLGVEKDTLDKAVAAAEKERAGNAYYTITGLD